MTLRNEIGREEGGLHSREESIVFHQDLHLEIGAESEERSHQVNCYRAGGETGWLDLEERREREVKI